MWQLENNTPFGAERAFVRGRDGAETWLVAIKATYLVTLDGTVVIGEQKDPVLSPEYFNEPGKSGLKYESDLQLTKLGTDILLHGCAYTPKSKPVPKMGVALKVGPVNKMLEVTGDRYWEKGPLGLKLSAAVPFEKMPIIYENSYGGIDNSKLVYDRQFTFPGNPLGVGFSLKEDGLEGKKAPNISYFKDGRKTTACFAPLPVDWMPRRGYGGTYDEKWASQQSPLLPDDFDERYYQCAPQDQQVSGYLKGGEPVEIFGMSPGGSLKFTLPKPDFSFKTILGRQIKEHRAQLHSVIFEPDESSFSMVWHTSLNCHNEDHTLETTIIT